MRKYLVFCVTVAAVGWEIADGQVPDVKTGLTDARTPLALAPGTPEGSYYLNQFESINLYSGKVNISVPVLTISGGGSAGYTLTVPVRNISWSVQVDTVGPTPCVNTPCLPYAHTSGPVWSGVVIFDWVWY